MATDPNPISDLPIVIKHEQSLIFESFNEDDALRLGNLTRELAIAANQAVTVVVRLSGSPVFVVAMPGTSPANFYWATRKARLVELYGQSSYRMGLESKASGVDVLEKAGLSRSEYAPHGGGFPIRSRAHGLIGSVIVSGLPQREDHILVISAIAKFLGKDTSELELPR